MSAAGVGAAPIMPHNNNQNNNHHHHQVRSATPPASLTYAHGYVVENNNDSTANAASLMTHRAMTPPPRWNMAALADAPKLVINEFRSQFTKNADVAFDEFCKKYLNSKNGFFSNQAASNITTPKSLQQQYQNHHNHHHHHLQQTANKPIIQHGGSINKISLNSSNIYAKQQQLISPNNKSESKQGVLIGR